MELNHEEVEAIISKISSGKDFIYDESRKDFIVLTYPSNELKQISDVVYKTTYDRAIKEGLLPLKDLENLLEERGVFTDEDQKLLTRLKSKLEAQNILLSKTVKVRANKERIIKVINDLKSQIETTIYKKRSKLIMSADSKSEESKNQYMCWACAKDLQSNLIWPSYEQYMSEANFNLRNSVLSSFITLINGVDLTTVRFVARSTLWRIRYISSMKTSDPLFGVPAANYTSDQLNLAYWSNFYDQVYSMMPDDRPQPSVIENDELLDAYMDEYYKELSNDSSISRSNRSKNKGSMSAFDLEEVIITQSNELYQEIKYDVPKEAQEIKDRVDIKKRAVSRR